MKRTRCPKCRFGNTTKLGEILRHTLMPDGNWKSSSCCVYWLCPKCDHSWQIRPAKIKK